MVSLYTKGLTTGDIQAHLLEIYGTEISWEISCYYCVRSRRGRRSSGTGMGRNALTFAPPVFPTG